MYRLIAIMIMNKSDLISNVAEQQGLTKTQAKAIVESVLDNIKSGVEVNGKVSLLGFGNFTKTTRAARTGRNPQTGAPINIAEKQVVKFKPQF